MDNERELDEIAKRIAQNKKQREPEPLFSWIYYNDGTVETNFNDELKFIRKKAEPKEERVEETPQVPKEPPKFDYDKLIAESTGLYRDWWIMWKRTHPEWALFPEQPNEQEVIIPSKPKVTLKKFSCKRCHHTWIPRSKEPTVQCPKCKSPYWNREKKKV